MYACTERYYRTFCITKGKKKRTIHSPKVALKVIQKWFGYHLGEKLDFNAAVFGFVKRRSAIQGAAMHCGAKWLYSVDIKDFFSSTPIEKVTTSLMALGYPGHGAHVIAKLCTYGGNLSQGSPASPVLSNLIFKDADIELESLAKEYQVQYTRYADDIIFSGKDVFPSEIKDKIHSVVESRGWQMSMEKERYAESPNRLKVYGLLVHGERPRLTKRYRNKIRAYAHLLETNKIGELDLARVKGHLAYARSVEEVDSKI
jgi:retron-type reverse transcriptase